MEFMLTGNEWEWIQSLKITLLGFFLKFSEELQVNNFQVVYTVRYSQLTLTENW